MPTESAKGSEKKQATSGGSATGGPESNAQQELIQALKRSQDAVLQAVSLWSESVQKIAPSLPDMPSLPLSDSFPKPEEVSDQFFSFAQKMLDEQQEFVKRLIEVLPGHQGSKH